MSAVAFYDAISALPQHIACRIVEDETSGCWLWTGPTSGKGRGGGYARASYLGRTTAVHLLLWRLSGRRLLRPGEQLDHECCNRCCVRLDHLVPRTQPLNIRLAYRRRRKREAAE